MHPNDFALVVAAARKEAERLIKSADRLAIQSFAPAFEIRGRNLWMIHGGVTADLGLVVAEKGDLGPRGIDGNNGRDGLDGKAGLDGKNGRDGLDGKDAIAKDGNDGADGVGIAKAYVSDAGYLIIVLTSGEKITAGHVKGKDGKNTEQVIFGGGAGSSGGGGGGDAVWGGITGTLADQTDLSSALSGKATAAQGALADTAVQPAALASYQPISAVLTATTASYTTAEQSKLVGIAAGATANSADATLLARANHTGTQLAATISDFSTAADARVTAGITGKQDTLVSATNIKTINGATILGAGNLVVAATAPVVTTLNYSGGWQTYSIPAGAIWLEIWCIGPGGNGAAGYSRAAGNAGGGGGGGGAGGMSRLRIPVSAIGQADIYCYPGQSSGGNVTVVSIASDTTSQNVLCRATAGSNATAGTATTAGGAGAAGAINTAALSVLASLGQPFFWAGQIGGAGGSNTGAGGASSTWGNTGTPTSGGGGGGGCTTTDFGGGRITGSGAVVANLLAGAAGGGAGLAGLDYGRFMWTGGSGGGSNNTGTGGAGGAGNIGCGGGGGGCGVTGGAGGAGGNGLIIITAIF